ncbi:MAG: site-specific DNA-methyltransferase [Prevotella sp.]|nr:site-specific DNA-methyltransferase [Prevotella sp.]
MPTLNWIGKDKVINHHQHVPFHVLEHRYGFTAEEGETKEETHSGNMIIHGDNLYALKSLLPQYEGRVDCIYIDPPYNTGEEKWVYNDNVNDPHMRRWLGQVVGKEGEDLSRHDKWLCMMYPRLKMLKKLMSKNGVIFISIDDNEVDFLRIICDEIFNKSCFVANVSWQRVYCPRNDSDGIPNEVEHILIYSKDPKWTPNRLERTNEMNEAYSSPDGDERVWASAPAHAPGAATHTGMVYAIQHPITGNLIYPPIGRCWTLGKDAMLDIMNEWNDYEYKIIDDYPIRKNICRDTERTPKEYAAIMLKDSSEKSLQKSIERYSDGKWPQLYFTRNGRGGMRKKAYLEEVLGKVVTNFWPHSLYGHNDEASKELKKIFGGKVPFDTPKPTRLIKRILEIATDKDSLILDSFAGSGTTAHAVLDLNKKDGGHRKFILIEMMDYANTITAERVKRVIKGYPYKGKKEEEIYSKKLTPKNLLKGEELLNEAKEKAEAEKDNYTKISKPKIQDNCLKVIGTKVFDDEMPGLGGAFDYYELGPALYTEDGDLNEAVGEETIREYIYFTETRQPLTRARQDEEDYLLDTWQDTAYYFYYQPGAQTELNDDTLVKMVRQKAEQYVIYADTCCLPEELMRNYRIIFKKIPRDIRKF